MASSDERQTRRNAASAALMRKSGVWRRGVGGTSGATTPAAITCLYPLDCADSEIVAIGGAGAIPASDATKQVFTYTYTVGGGVRIAAPTGFNSDTHTPIENSGKRVYEVAFTHDVNPSETGWVDFAVFTYIDTVSGISLTVQSSAGGMFGSSGVSSDIAGFVAVWVDYDTGDYKFYNGLTEQVANYTPYPLKSNPYIKITATGNSVAIGGSTVNITVRTSKADLLGTYPAGTMTLCGEVL